MQKRDMLQNPQSLKVCSTSNRMSECVAKDVFALDKSSARQQQSFQDLMCDSEVWVCSAVKQPSHLFEAVIVDTILHDRHLQRSLTYTIMH